MVLAQNERVSWLEGHCGICRVESLVEYQQSACVCDFLQSPSVARVQGREGRRQGHPELGFSRQLRRKDNGAGSLSSLVRFLSVPICFRGGKSSRGCQIDLSEALDFQKVELKLTLPPLPPSPNPHKQHRVVQSVVSSPSQNHPGWEMGPAGQNADSQAQIARVRNTGQVAQEFNKHLQGF